VLYQLSYVGVDRKQPANGDFSRAGASTESVPAASGGRCAALDSARERR
jgi:hypothetical protein